MGPVAGASRNAGLVPGPAHEATWLPGGPPWAP